MGKTEITRTAKTAWKDAGNGREEKQIVVKKVETEVVTVSQEKKKPKKVQPKLEKVEEPCCSYLNLVKTLQIFGSLSLILIGVVHAMMVIHIVQNIDGVESVATLVSLAVYVAMCVMLLMSVWERQSIEKWALAIYSWIGLGLMQITIAVFTLSASIFIDIPDAPTSFLETAVSITCFTAMGVGTLFTTLGCFCGGRGKHKDKKKNQAEDLKKRQLEVDKKNKAAIKKAEETNKKNGHNV